MAMRISPLEPTTPEHVERVRRTCIDANHASAIEQSEECAKAPFKVKLGKEGKWWFRT
jgi:hypothetical protein